MSQHNREVPESTTALKAVMKVNRILHGLILVSIVLAGRIVKADAPAPDAAEHARIFSYAIELYREGRWSGAYGRFARLADAGDVQAARLALHMLREGATLYGTPWGASQPQIDLWTRLVATPLPELVSVSSD